MLRPSNGSRSDSNIQEAASTRSRVKTVGLSHSHISCQVEHLSLTKSQTLSLLENVPGSNPTSTLTLEINKLCSQLFFLSSPLHGTFEQGTKPAIALIGPAMGWCLIQGCTLPSPICSWDWHQHPRRDPERDKENEMKQTYKLMF